MVPINRMVPRSFITNIKSGDPFHAGRAALARGIAFGGDTGVARVDFSSDGGKSWQAAELGKDEGKYSFRQWQIQFTLPVKGDYVLMVRCTNSQGGFVRATAGRLRWAQHAQTQAAIRPRGRSTRPTRRSAFVCKPGG